MRKSPIHKIVLIIFLISYFSNSGIGQSIWVGIHDDIITSETSTTTSGNITIFSPTSVESKLKVSDINAALAIGDVRIDAPDGNINFQPGTFSPLTGQRTLFLASGGNITYSRIQPELSNELSMNLDVCAVGNFTVNGPGVYAHSGSVYVNVRGNIDITSGSINSGGGNVTLLAQGDVSTKFRVVFTEGGDFVAQGINFECYGINTISSPTEGGRITLNFLEDVEIKAAGLNCGDLTVYAKSFVSVGPGNITVGASPGIGGDVSLNIEENIIISGGGISVNGNFESFGQNITLSGTGVNTAGGDVDMCHNGNIIVQGCGITTFLEDLNTPGGNVKIQTTGFLSVMNGGGIYTGYAHKFGTMMNSEGGNVEVRADSIFTYGPSINTGVKRSTLMMYEGYTPGSGTLTTFPPIGTPSPILIMNRDNLTFTDNISYPGNNIPVDPAVRSLGPYVGGGNIILDVVNLPDCISPSVPAQESFAACVLRNIPTIGTWAILVMFILFSIIGIVVNKRTQNVAI